MKIPFILTISIILGFSASATNLQISNTTLYFKSGTPYAVLNLKWENSWKNERNHDAVWLFFKSVKKEGGYKHILIGDAGHDIVFDHPETNPNLYFETSSDSLGVFIYNTSRYRGDINLTLRISLSKESFKNIDNRNSVFNAYGIEMVYIPEGAFAVGDPDPNAFYYGSFYTSDQNGETAGTFRIESESSSIEIGPQEGKLYYRSNGYEGDQQGPVPASFPKGVRPFYIMKYEPNQGQYVDFLNSLSDYQSQHRTNFGGRNYYELRGSIRIENGKYVADHPFAPCNYMSWDDAMAYADWAGLRPMTEFEFTKAARGPIKPSASEFPWGSNKKEQVQRMVSHDGKLIMANGMEESELTDENTKLFAASHYWVMDLAGSLWERVISVGHSKGRAFTGNHGDGKITNYGFADVEGWPSGVTEEGGFGFRGGGFYNHGRDYHEFNPFSPVSYRPYGGWSGGNRTEGYGARFVRTAPR